MPRVGAQRPTHLLTPEGDFDFSDGDDAVELAEQLGLCLFDWQRWLVRWILAVDSRGLPACSQVIIIVPRQNGKGAVLEAIELYWLMVAGIPNVIHTAHETDTAAGHQARLESLTAEPDVSIPLLKSYQANGKEKIKNLDEGLLLQFRTRTKATKRGASPQRVVLDECQELQKAHLGALVPAMAAQSMSPEKMPQLIYAGSAPLEHSLYMHDLLAKIQDQRPAKTLLAMWACGPDVDPADVEAWYRVNPSLGLLISEDYVRDTEYLVLDTDSFLAERLGVPQGGPDDHGDHPIDPDGWARLRDADSRVADDKACRIALDAPRMPKSASFGIAGRRSDEFTHFDLRSTVARSESQSLKAAVVAKAKELSEFHGTPIIIPPGSPARQWIADLEEAGVELDLLTGDEFAQACGMAEAAVADESIRHRGQPEMYAAVAGLAPRKFGDVDVWSRRNSSVNIAPFVAATCALVRVPQPAAVGAGNFYDLDEFGADDDWEG